MLVGATALPDWNRFTASLTFGPGEADRAASCWLVFCCSASLRGDLRTLPVRGGSLTGEVAAAAREGDRTGERGMAEALIVDSPLLLASAIFSVESEPESDDLVETSLDAGALDSSTAVAGTGAGSRALATSSVAWEATDEIDCEAEPELAPLPVLRAT